MSDQSQGEGWWIASDGKWYPPESHPDAGLPPTEPTDAATPEDAMPEDAMPADEMPADEMPEDAVPEGAMPPPTGDPTPLDLPTEASEPAEPTLQQTAAVGAMPGEMVDYTDDDRDSTEGSSSRGKVVAAMIVLALLIAGAVTAIVLTSDDDDPDTAETVADPSQTVAADTTTTTSVPETTTTEIETTTTTPETTTTTTIDERPGADFDNPAPLVDAEFEWDESGTIWDTELFGLVKVDQALDDKEKGQCVLLLGTLTPTSISGGVISSGFNTPNFGAIADGAYIDSTITECDDDGATKAGYGWILDAEVTEGTAYAFFTELFIPGKPPATLEVITAGDPTREEALYFTPDEIDKIPPVD